MRTNKQIRHDAKRLLRLCLSEDVLSEPRVRRVVERLTASRRRDRFALLGQFHRRLALECARNAATVESAVALPPDLLARVQAGLTRAYGRGLQVTYRQRPALIGGLRVHVGSDVYDGTVRGKLVALETRL